MKNHRNLDVTTIIRIIIAAFVACAAVCALAACSTSEHSQSAQTPQTKTEAKTKTSDPLTVVASVNQWGTLAAQIGGEHVKVTSVLNGTNVDAHDFEPTTADISRFTTSQVAVVNGANYDAWATKALSSLQNISVVNAATTVGAGSSDNAHLWFSKDARAAVAEALKNAYSQLLPEHKDYFQEQFDEWKSQEDELTSKIEKFKATHKGKKYAATESVAYYLYSDLGLVDATPKGYADAAANESEPDAAALQAFQSAIESHDMQFVVNNPQEASDATNMITGTAGKSDVPVVDITEQMPKDYSTLSEWISALVDQAQTTMDQSTAK